MVDAKIDEINRQVLSLRSDVAMLRAGRARLLVNLTPHPMVQLSARGIMDEDDYAQLCVEVQQLADDVAEIREALLFIVDQLKV